MNKNEAVFQWLQGCEQIKDLFFAFSKSENGDTVIAPISTDVWADGSPFIDGSGEKIYELSIIRYESVSDLPNTTENAILIDELEKITDWIIEQAKNGVFPDFGSQDTITDLEVVSTPDIAGSDEAGAKIMFSIRIQYLHQN